MMLRHKFGYLIMAVLTVAVVWALLDRVTDKNAEQSAQLTKQSGQLGEQQDDIRDLEAANKANAEKLEANGLEPAVDPEDATEPVAPVDPDDTTEELSKGDVALVIQACINSGECDASPTAAQLAEAFVTYCSDDGTCRGRPGKDGKDARPPSLSMVLAALEEACNGSCEGKDGESVTPEQVTVIVGRTLVDYCAERNECRGPKGDPSTVPGPQGIPGKSAYEVAVEAGFTGTRDEWLASLHGKDGTDGKDSNVPGPKGDKGEPGRGIQSVSCNADGSWTFTYTDGTSQTVAGPCRAEQPVQPETR